MGIKKGQVVQLSIESTAFKGKGVARYEGQAVFIPNTAPGDVVEARIIKKKKKYLEAKVLTTIKPSSLRQQPVCSHANVCGGCTWQHIPYEEQLKFKEQHVRDLIERIAGLPADIVKPIIGCENDLYYRNKMEYSFGTRRWLTEKEIRSDEYVDDEAFAAGLHAPGRYDKILNLKECHLQDKISFRILDFVRNYCVTNNIPAFDTYHKKGFIRHLVVRNSYYTGDLMVNIVTFEDQPDIMEILAGSLINEFPEITTIVNNINDQHNPTATGRYENILFGPGYITDRIGRHTFKIDANAFFQTNTKQAEVLYNVARLYCDGTKNRHLFDLYCGVGTLSLYMADAFDKVTGIELVDIAIQNARYNSKENNVHNVDFVLGDMKDTFNDKFLVDCGQPDCIITDPPRSGMHPDVVEQLSKLEVPRLVYVSCNPSTMARDLLTLKNFYDIKEIQPVDMFPQTYHIEAVAKCNRKK
ncbi:MAG: 23S rRNA (uracil(1939)-C(5))-methyltransferase RlmD [Balneolaceae bacterium]|nr:MAG: 23S rRNA (uracil(1939)-C(5))-methyltransferase RlmD [Balneolaceae bacterium]